MEIKNWCVRDVEGRLTLLTVNGKVNICGNVYKNTNFPDGAYVKTGTVKEINQNSVVTCSGSEYDLENMDKHYAAYLNAVKEGIPVLTKWVLLEKNLSGNDEHGKRIRGVVVDQDFESNICTFEDGTKVFVDWHLANTLMLARLRFLSTIMFCGIKCMPNIFGK